MPAVAFLMDHEDRRRRPSTADLQGHAHDFGNRAETSRPGPSLARLITRENNSG